MIQIAMIVSGAVLILAVALVCAAGFFAGWRNVWMRIYPGERD